MIRSDYSKFLEVEYQNRELSTYEKLCNLFGKISIPLSKGLEQKFLSEINFCHLKVKPSGVFSTAIFLSLIVFALLFSIFYFLNILSIVMILMLIILSLVTFYYMFSYTSFLTKYFRGKAAGEMSLAVIYMSISLKINASLESAVAFAAMNLSGPLGLDLKKILWDLETGNLLSVINGLDYLSEKWKSESEEFVDAITLLKASINEPPDKMDKSIREAVMLVTEGTKARMKKYALAMRSPLKVLNAFGILLPMLVLIFFPVLVIFVPELAKSEIISFSYIVLLPITVYLFLNKYFYSKPYSYHQVEMKNLEGFRKQKIIVLILSILIALIPTAYLLYQLSTIQTIFSDEQFIDSLLIVVVLSSSVIFYSFLSSFNHLEKNKDILRIESELPIALFQLSINADIGKPVEKNIEDLLPRIKTLKISEVFKKIINNITTSGMTLSSAIFEKGVGAIYSYPSRIIYMAFQLIVDISKRGMTFLSLALKSMSEFLKDADEVNNATDEILSETTSDMQIQALVFAPLSAGIVVGLMAIIIYLFAFFGQSMQSIEEFLGKDALGGSAVSAFSFLMNIGNQIPFHYFQIVVGVYMIEIVYIISHFLGELNYGNDEVSKLLNQGKVMLIGIVIYGIVVCLLYFGIASFMKVSELSGLA
jgi:hypothetical protein